MNGCVVKTDGLSFSDRKQRTCKIYKWNDCEFGNYSSIQMNKSDLERTETTLAATISTSETESETESWSGYDEPECSEEQCTRKRKNYMKTTTAKKLITSSILSTS